MVSGPEHHRQRQDEVGSDGLERNHHLLVGDPRLLESTGQPPDQELGEPHEAAAADAIEDRRRRVRGARGQRGVHPVAGHGVAREQSGEGRVADFELQVAHRPQALLVGRERGVQPQRDQVQVARIEAVQLDRDRRRVL